MRKTMFATALLALAIAPALAQQHDHANHGAHAGHGQHAGHAHDHGTATAELDFDRLDTNGDGAIARDELPADHPLLPHFEMSDADGDGRLDRDEFEAAKSML